MEKIQEMKKELKVLRLENAKLLKLAFKDSMLGVKNRTWLNFHKKNYKDVSCFLTIIDANGLKRINDIKGHTAGDEFLKEIIQGLRRTFSLFGKFEIVRLGGDEFLVISQEKPYIFESRIIEELRLFLGDKISAGVCYKFEKLTFYKAMKQADARMYEAKQFYYLKGNSRIGSI